MESPDFIVENHGSLFMVRVVTPTAQAWIDDNVPLESWQWLGHSFSVEHRYIEDLVDGMIQDGFVVN